jgi:hypothetical protein
MPSSIRQAARFSNLVFHFSIRPARQWTGERQQEISKAFPDLDPARAGPHRLARNVQKGKPRLCAVGQRHFNPLTPFVQPTGFYGDAGPPVETGGVFHN